MVLAGDSSKTNNPELIKIYISPRHFITSNWPRRSLYRKYCGIRLYIVYPLSANKEIHFLGSWTNCGNMEYINLELLD